MKKIAGLLSFIFFGMLYCQKINTDQLTLFHTNDVKGELVGCGCRKGGGGILQRAEFLSIQREIYPNHILLDAGNFNLLPFRAQKQPSLIFDLYDQLGYDVVNMTPFDFAGNLDSTLKIIQRTRARYISASFLKNGKPLFEPYVILNRSIQGKPKKIAVLGIFDDVKQECFGAISDNQLKLVPPDFVLTHYLEELKAKADYIILLSYNTPEGNDQLAKNNPGLLAIIGSGPQPGYSHEIEGRMVVQAHHIGKYLGIINYRFNADIPGEALARMEAIDRDAKESSQLLEFLEKKYPDWRLINK